MHHQHKCEKCGHITTLPVSHIYREGDGTSLRDGEVGYPFALCGIDGTGLGMIGYDHVGELGYDTDHICRECFALYLRPIQEHNERYQTDPEYRAEFHEKNRARDEELLAIRGRLHAGMLTELRERGVSEETIAKVGHETQAWKERAHG